MLVSQLDLKMSDAEVNTLKKRRLSNIKCEDICHNEIIVEYILIYE